MKTLSFVFDRYWSLAMAWVWFFCTHSAWGHVPLSRVELLKHANRPEVELASHLFKGAKGNGYAIEAAQEIRYWAYQSHSLNQLVSYINHGNCRSQSVTKRLGAETDGSRADHEPDAEIWRHLAVN